MIRKIILLVLCALLILRPLPARAETPPPSPAPNAGPVITLKGDASMTVNAAFTFEDPGATAQDAQGGDLTDRIAVEGAVIPYLVGEYTLTYTVADDDGKQAQATRTVTVALTMYAGETTTPWNTIAAAAIVACVPLVIMVLICQRRIVSGMVDGAVKG